MKIRNTRIFPYPVLSSMYDDYINSAFSIELKAKKTKKSLFFEITPIIQCNTLLSLLSQNKAELVAHFECAQTRFRTIKKLVVNQVNNIEFKSGDLNEKLEVVAFVMSTANIPNFQNIYREFNPDYGNASFYIEEGSMLAISNQKEIQVPKDIYDLSNVNSIVSITSKQKEDDSKNIEILLDDRKIRVMLPRETYVDYSGMGKTENQYTPILHTMFVFPALVYALDYLKALDEDKWMEVEDYTWVKVFKKKVEALHGSFDKAMIEKYTSPVLAQELIENPYPTATNTLLGMEPKK